MIETQRKTMRIVWKEGRWTKDPRQTNGILGGYGPRLNSAEIADEEAFFFHIYYPPYMKDPKPVKVWLLQFILDIPAMSEVMGQPAQGGIKACTWNL